MADTTLPALLATGDHASRPAASAAGSGGLYACSTHGLIYQTDGSTWSTWATLGGSGDVATDSIWDTKGDIAVATGANTASKLAVGATNGHVLTIDSGEATGLKWAAAGGTGGALVLLEQHAASSSANLNFTTAITSTYDEYLIELIELVPATNGADLQMLVSHNTGSTYDTNTVYHWSASVQWNGGTAAQYAASNNSAFSMTGYTGGGVNNTASKGGYCGSLRLFNPLGTTAYKRVLWTGSARMGDDNFGIHHCGGEVLDTSVVNALRFQQASGNIASGTIRMYGIAK